MKEVKIPGWMNSVSNNAIIGIREVKEIFGYSKNTNSAAMMFIKKYDMKSKTITRNDRRSKVVYLWRMSDIRKLVSSLEKGQDH